MLPQNPENAVPSEQTTLQPEPDLRSSAGSATRSWDRDIRRRPHQYQHSEPQRHDGEVQRSAVLSRRATFPCGNACAILLACQLATGVAILMALGLTFLPRPPQDDDQPHDDADEDPRERRLVHMVWYVGNDSLNPCTDFQRYTCYNYDAAHTHGTVLGQQEPMKNVLEGLSRTDAGRLLFVFYNSCLKTMWMPSSAGRQAVRAILDTIYFDADMSTLQLLASVVKLNLAYGLHGNLIIYQNNYGKFPSSLPQALASTGQLTSNCGTEKLFLFAAPKTLLHHGNSTKDILQGHVGEAFEELRKHGVNVSTKQLVQFADRLLISSRKTGHFEDKTELLGDLVHGVSTRLWIDMVTAHTSLNVDTMFLHSSLDALKRRLSTLLDQRLQPVNTAFIVLEAAVALIPDDVEGTFTASRLYRFCERAARTLRPVWALNDLMHFSAKTEHNHAVLAMFRRLADTLGEQLKESLNSQDASVLEQRLTSLRLFMPYHIYPTDMALPNLTADYFSNELRLRQWRLTRDRYIPPQGFCQNQVELVHLLQPTLGGDAVIIPLGLYKAVSLDPRTSLLPMVTFGYVIANMLWSALFEVPWTPGGEDVFRRLDSGDSVIQDSLISRPHLALDLCIRALKLDHWHDLSLYWGHWRTSRSRVFYRLLVLYYYCVERYHAKSELVAFVDTLMRGTPDFMESFDCPHDLALAKSFITRLNASSSDGVLVRRVQ